MLGIFLDIEATGLNPLRHKIIEIAYKVVDVATGELKNEFQAVIFQEEKDWSQSDPESLRVNGFTWEEVERGEKVDKVAGEIKSTFAQLNVQRGSAVFICQNPSFDRAYFSQLIDADLQDKMGWPYHWLDLASMYWSEAVHLGKRDYTRFPWNSGFTKDRIAKTYHLPSEEKPHRAMSGVNHLIACYAAVVGFPNEVL